MKLKNGTKQLITTVLSISLIAGLILALSACSVHRRVWPRHYASNQGSAEYDRDEIAERARTSGLAEDGRFSDHDRLRSGQLISKRTYYFDFDSNVIHSEDKPAMTANAEYLISHPGTKIILEGHTDPRGSREYNIGLGERRAKAIAEYLSSKGVGRSQIRIVSYGAQKLAGNGHTESDYQLDRRGVVVYIQKS